MKVHIASLGIASACFIACSPQQPSKIVKTNGVNPLAWIDTVRFNSNLTEAQRQQVYFVRNNEEDYEKLTDTARIALRFSWWRAFHPYVVVRVENRPEIRDSSGVHKLYEEWLALYKENITRLNHDCPVQKDGKCFGKPLPFLHQQNVVMLKANEVPHIVRQLDAMGFWQMKPAYESGPHTDGSSWTLEVFYKGRYKVVTTNIPNDSVKQLCLEMLRISNYKAKANEIY